MKPVDILVIVAGALAVIEIFESKGRALLAWAILLIAIALMWSRALIA